MSYSSDAKKDMLNADITRKCCNFAQLYGIFVFLAKIKTENDITSITLSTENQLLCEKIISTLSSLFKVECDYEIIHKKHSRYSTHCISISDKKSVGKLLKVMRIKLDETGEAVFSIDRGIIDKSCCKKSFVRGAFLASGSLIHPEKKYHMEFCTYHRKVSGDFEILMGELGLNPKVIQRKKSYVIYFKNSDEIADILSMTGVFDTLMDFHNIRIMKDLRNKNNRIINCETANTEKTHMAAIEHILAIQKLKKSSKWDGLSPVLKEIAELRLEYKEASLKDLGDMFTPKLTRSGVNHRLKRLVEMAKNLEGEE